MDNKAKQKTKKAGNGRAKPLVAKSDDDFELSKVLKVKPELDYNNIKYVNIIK